MEPDFPFNEFRLHEFQPNARQNYLLLCWNNRFVINTM
jgi:hypothetical protein